MATTGCMSNAMRCRTMTGEGFGLPGKNVASEVRVTNHRYGVGYGPSAADSIRTETGFEWGLCWAFEFTAVTVYVQAVSRLICGSV
jgi:hypothetical protein